jgi:CheY-like chemotaxis protein
MPEQDGYSLMRQVRVLPCEQGGQIPVIAITAYAGERDRQEAIAAGFQRHLSKPVMPDELANVIAKLIS